MGKGVFSIRPDASVRKGIRLLVDMMDSYDDMEDLFPDISPKGKLYLRDAVDWLEQYAHDSVEDAMEETYDPYGG